MTVNSFLISLVLLVSVFAVAEIGILAYNTNKVIKETNKVVVETQQMLSEVHAYTTSQLKNLSEQQKVINASIQAAAVFNGTGRLLNTQTIPRINKALESLNDSIVSANSMIQNTDASVNKILLPQINETAKAFNVSVDTINRSIIEITAQSSLTFQEIRDTMSSDEWKEILANVASTTGHIDGISRNLQDTSDHMPAMATLIEKMMKTTSKYQKALILSQIVSALARAF